VRRNRVLRVALDEKQWAPHGGAQHPQNLTKVVVPCKPARKIENRLSLDDRIANSLSLDHRIA
jgi:hypothetical protein